MERIILRARLEKMKETTVKLIRSENGFRRINKEELSEADNYLRTFQSAMNKLTEQNYQAVVPGLCMPQLIKDENVLKGAVNIIFSKAVAEPVFSSLYARVIEDICSYEVSMAKSSPASSEPDPEVVTHAEPSLKQRSVVRKMLVERCQEFFKGFLDLSTTSDTQTMSDEEKEEYAESLRKKNMSNIKFIGELYMRSLLSERVMLEVCETPLKDGSSMLDAKMDMAISLLKVVGKKFDEAKCADDESKRREKVWEGLQKAVSNNSLSSRIRFLLQNLIDLRKNRWRKEISAGAMSVASSTMRDMNSGNRTINRNDNNTSDGTPTGSNVGWSNNYGTGGKGGNKPAHGKYHDPSGSGGGMGRGSNRFGSLGGDGDERPIGRHGSSGGLSSNAAIPDIPAEEKRIVALATPPQALTEEVEKLFLSSLRDSMTDGLWEETIKTIKEKLQPTVPEHVGAMCAAFSVIKYICVTSDAEEREFFTKALNKCECFDASVVARAYSWYLTHAIINGLKGDYPKVYDRFREVLMKTESVTFCMVLRDVLARTANYVEALSRHDESELEQQEELVDMWSAIVKHWRTCHPKEEVDPHAVVETLKEVKQRNFMQDIAPDCFVELLNEKFLTIDAIQAWISTAEDPSKMKENHKILFDQFNDLLSIG